ncbi:MAG: hypothetical protein RLZZ239_1008, partial [Pseudomonadota bacterium]
WDIDPLAAPLFKWRHARELQRHGTTLQFHTGDGLAQLAELVQRMPQAFFWFDNVLGQLRFIEPPVAHRAPHAAPRPQTHHDPSDATHRRLKALQKTLAPVSWGSVHDRMSGPTLAHTPCPPAHRTHAGLAMEAPEAQAWTCFATGYARAIHRMALQVGLCTLAGNGLDLPCFKPLSVAMIDRFHL